MFVESRVPGPVPRIINQVWLNGDPPDTLLRLQERMMRLNPGYDLRLWKPENFPPLYNARWYAEIEGLSYKSDIARYEILWRHPGIYVDFDAIFWRGFDDIFGDAGCSSMPDNFFVRESDERINNAIFGVGPGSPIAAALVERLDLSARRHKEVGGRAHMSGVVYFTRVVESFPETAYVLPRRTFHSGLNVRCAIKAARDPKYACLACHFYNNIPDVLGVVEHCYLTGELSDAMAVPPPPPVPPRLRWNGSALAPVAPQENLGA